MAGRQTNMGMYMQAIMDERATYPAHMANHPRALFLDRLLRETFDYGRKQSLVRRNITDPNRVDLKDKKKKKMVMNEIKILPRMGVFPGGIDYQEANERVGNLFPPALSHNLPDPIPRRPYDATLHNPSDEGEYDFEAEVNGNGKSKKCRKCGKRKKLLGGSFEKLKALRLVAGNAGTNKQNMRAAIDTQGYTNVFIQAGAYPQGNGRLTRPEQVNILDTTWLIAQYEVNNGLMTQAEAATISPTRHFTQAEVQNFINSLP